MSRYAVDYVADDYYAITIIYSFSLLPPSLLIDELLIFPRR